MTGPMHPPLPALLIPAYEPDLPLLAGLIQECAGLGFTRFLLVDDGSAHHPLARLDPGPLSSSVEIVRLRHAVNLGKGAALKTGFNEYLNRIDSGNWITPGLITVDADGQHRPGDVLRVARQFLSAPASLCLGLRKFTGRVPMRSRFGNQLTRLAFRFFCGADLGDTQTGLRAIPNSLLPELLPLTGQRYEYELEMLVHVSRQRLPITQVEIETVYLDGNSSSHFNPLIDSMRVYFVFLRFSFSSLITFGVDTLLFLLVFRFTETIALSTIAARLGAGLCNFAINRNLVFHSGNRWPFEMARYWMVVALLGTVSVVCVSRFADWGWNLLTAKVTVELLLFLASFPIQRLFVFLPGSRLPRATDWTSYYERPGRLTGFSRPITYQKVLDCFARFTDRPTSIAELGGAGSQICDLLTHQRPGPSYHVFDLNEAGNERFRKDHQDRINRDLWCHTVDLLDPPAELLRRISASFDAVFSIGLIEHFGTAETARMIERHFEFAKPGGMVLITFPTPTAPYRIIRRLSEILRLWIFHDERPLGFSEVESCCDRYGVRLHREINWWIGLTQGIVVYRRHGGDATVSASDLTREIPRLNPPGPPLG